MSDLTQNDILAGLVKDIAKAAKSVAYQWPGVVDADDVTQSISLRLLESPGSARKVSGMDPRDRHRALVGLGHQIASAERADYDHYKGSYRYSVAEAKTVLGKGILIEPLPGFNDISFDLTVALAVLEESKPQYAEAIKLRYEMDETPQVQQAKDALKNGLPALVDEMNRSHRIRFSERDEGPGTRKPVTRAQAYDASSGDWDGGEW